MNNLLNILETALEDIKAEEITIIDVKGLTSITDVLVICTGRSRRHIASVSEHIVDAMKAVTDKPKVQGLLSSEWVIVDIGDIIVHIMQKEMREFYQLEKLWDRDLIISNSNN